MCAFKIEFILFSAFTALLILFLTGSNQQVFSQSPGGVVSAPQLESVKIVNLLAGQNVDLQKELLVTGESSDNASKDCSVYVIVNNVQPYQNAAADGTGGTKDFSQWKFVLHDSYTHLNEGQNKITAKLLCSTSPTRWYSVVVNGVAGLSIANAPAAMDTTSPQTNESEQAPIDTTVQQEQAPIDTTAQVNDTEQAPTDTTVQQEQAPIDTTAQVNDTEQAPIDTTAQVNDTEQAPTDTTVQQEQAPIDTTVQQTNETEAPIDTTAPQSNEEVQTQTDTTSTIDTLSSQRNVTEPSVETSPSQPSGLIVKILPLKDPLARGDSQNATIIVTDSDNNPISGAQIDGNLVYPGNNFEKGFKGTTDATGKFVYSWIAGKKGDVGPLVIEVDVSSEEHPPTHAEISVDLVESDESSQILNPFQSHFEQP